MANSKAFIKKIDPVGSGNGEDNSVHQTSPAWVLTFVRWEVRDTLRTSPTDSLNFSTTRDPLVVENDCVQVSTNTDKGTLTGNMNATLKMTDVNYETAVAPGDFVIVNMLNWESDARKVADKARAKKPINGPNDGFKGIFKVQGVRKSIVTDPASGKKFVLLKITGFSFTEFNNTIYFNQELIDSSEKQNLLLFSSNIGTNWAILQNQKGITNVQDLIEALIDSFIGKGIGSSGKYAKDGNIKSFNSLFFIPQLVGSLLGVPSAKAAKDIYNYLFGIQTYSNGKNATLASGMNPSNLVASDGSRVWKTTSGNLKCQGDTVTKPEYWNQVKVWSILNQFTNAPLNEMFTTFRISPEGNVMPTLVFRQIPFTTEDFDSNNRSVTRFMNLPRWKVNPALVLNMDIGRDEAARINFVQFFARSSLGPEGYSISAETAQKNYLYDIDDVKRSGLRPFVINSTFDETVPEGKESYRSVYWARIIGDALIGGHLKMNGTIQTAGIIDPISVGDNLEFDGIVYHIERVSHSATMDMEGGNKTFRTTIGLSSGVSVDSNVKGTRYAEMTYGGAYDLRDVDYENNQILPGVSESQDVFYRPDNVDGPITEAKAFKQPNNNTSVNKNGTENTYKEKDKK